MDWSITMSRKLKNILVTGGAGFIGSNFINYLFGLSATGSKEFMDSGFEGRIVNVDCLTYAGNLENLAMVEEKFGTSACFGSAQQPVADLVDEPVEVHPDLVLGEEMRMLLDERDDVVVLLHRGMEAELPVTGDDELVTADPLPVLVQTDERRVTHPVLPVADIASITEDVHHGEPLHIVLISEFHILIPV